MAKIGSKIPLRMNTDWEWRLMGRGGLLSGFKSHINHAGNLLKLIELGYDCKHSFCACNRGPAGCNKGRTVRFYRIGFTVTLDREQWPPSLKLTLTRVWRYPDFFLVPGPVLFFGTKFFRYRYRYSEKKWNHKKINILKYSAWTLNGRQAL